MQALMHVMSLSALTGQVLCDSMLAKGMLIQS